ncbi:hypothetical protein BV20DRAFT_699815 [Pilatotrama ljubarskyi]|nr:hypothetical protein BV20DRAFT_699815 [Pilatotrama ljubarskyi]
MSLCRPNSGAARIVDLPWNPCTPSSHQYSSTFWALPVSLLCSPPRYVQVARSAQLRPGIFALLCLVSVLSLLTLLAGPITPSRGLTRLSLPLVTRHAQYPRLRIIAPCVPPTALDPKSVLGYVRPFLMVIRPAPFGIDTTCSSVATPNAAAGAQLLLHRLAVHSISGEYPQCKESTPHGRTTCSCLPTIANLSILLTDIDAIATAPHVRTISLVAHLLQLHRPLLLHIPSLQPPFILRSCRLRERIIPHHRALEATRIPMAEDDSDTRSSVQMLYLLPCATAAVSHSRIHDVEPALPLWRSSRQTIKFSCNTATPPMHFSLLVHAYPQSHGAWRGISLALQKQEGTMYICLGAFS